MKKTSFLAIILQALLLVSSASAQSINGESSAARVEKIERDLMLLQRQISRTSGDSQSAPSSGTVNNASLEVRLSGIEEQIRTLVGKIEENDFQVKRLTQNLEKMQKDTDFRFSELTNSPVNERPAPASQATQSDEKLIKPRNATLENTENDASQSGRPIGKVVDTAPAEQDSHNEEAENAENVQTDFAIPREHYNYAFRLLNQTQYDKAAKSFADFIKKYPKDQLTGNAYYWQGEILYIRRNYVAAADSFRQGFEEMPTGPKAPDNLLKLAMTLNALKRDKEACVVLAQVVTKFKTASAAVAQKAGQEQKRIGCS